MDSNDIGTGLPGPLGMDRPVSRLRRVLRLNAAFSLVTGLSAVVAAGPVAELLGIDQVWLVRATGAALVGFAGTVAAIARVDSTSLGRLARLVSLADLAWVIGTVPVVAAGWLSVAGAVTMAVIGLVVLDLAVLQLLAAAGIEDRASWVDRPKWVTMRR